MKIPENWTFKNKEVADNFNNHVREQLPWYNMATDMTCQLARSYLQDNSVLLDMACSTGNITRGLKQTIEDRNITAISMDTSKDMASQFEGVGTFMLADMTDIDLVPEFDVCVIMLGVMFTPIKNRRDWLNKLKVKCSSGGAIIIVDKVNPISGYLGQCITRLTIKNKLDAGVDPIDIIEKELSLSGIQRPTPEFAFENNNFRKWLQIGDFCGFICEVS